VQVRQWEVPHTSENYIMKEMGFAGRKHAIKTARAVFCFFITAALAVPSLTMVFMIATRNPTGCNLGGGCSC
jgi:hypothetical protein